MKRPARKPMTLEELDALEDATGQRYELWRGEPVAMTGGTLRHNLIALGLSRAIYPWLQPGCRVVVADVKLRLGEAMDSNATYPNVMVVCDPLPGSYQTRPVLLAEVLSDSSTRCDRVDKHAAYTALESLEAYLILSQQQVLVDMSTRARRTGGGCAARDGRARSGSWRSASPCRFARYMPMCWRIWAIESWRDAALRGCEKTVASEGRSRCIPRTG